VWKENLRHGAVVPQNAALSHSMMIATICTRHGTLSLTRRKSRVSAADVLVGPGFDFELLLFI